MTYTQMQNKAGKFVAPSDETFASAAAGIDWSKAPGYYLIMTDAPGDASWPIAATNFILMYKQPKDAARSKAVTDFFSCDIQLQAVGTAHIGVVDDPGIQGSEGLQRQCCEPWWPAFDVRSGHVPGLNLSWTMIFMRP